MNNDNPTLRAADFLSPSDNTQAGPGTRLAQLRTEAGLTLDDVSEYLHLKRHILESLENNAFATLGSHVFIRGYLRGYAQMLGVAPQEVIAEFDALGLDDKHNTAQPIAARTHRPVKHSRVMESVFKSASYLVFIAMVLLVGTWWYMHPMAEDTPVDKMDLTQTIEPEAIPAEATVAPTAGQDAVLGPVAPAEMASGASAPAATQDESQLKTPPVGDFSPIPVVNEPVSPVSTAAPATKPAVTVTPVVKPVISATPASPIPASNKNTPLTPTPKAPSSASTVPGLPSVTPPTPPLNSVSPAAAIAPAPVANPSQSVVSEAVSTSKLAADNKKPAKHAKSTHQSSESAVVTSERQSSSWTEPRSAKADKPHLSPF